MKSKVFTAAFDRIQAFNEALKQNDEAQARDRQVFFGPALAERLGMLKSERQAMQQAAHADMVKLRDDFKALCNSRGKEQLTGKNLPDDIKLLDGSAM